MRSNTQLIGVFCSNNLLTNVDVRGIVNLEYLECGHNQISELLYDAASPNWYDFDVSYNQLSSILIPRIYSYDAGILNISGNLYTEVQLPEDMLLSEFYCNNTQLTSLDLSNLKSTRDILNIIGNNHLTHINLKNGRTDFCIPEHPDETCWFHNTYIANNPLLQLLCVYDLSIYNEYSNTYISEEEYFHDVAPSVSSYCSFTPGGAYNTIAGTIKFDADGNGCSNTDAVAKMAKILISGGSIGSTFTDQNGHFITYTSYGNMRLEPQFENPYYTVSPTSFTSAFTGYGNTVTADFCIVPNGTHADLEIEIVPVGNARPGFDAVYNIIYKNKGNQTLSGSVVLNYNNDVLDYISANPAASQSANSLSWSFDALEPFQSKTISATLNLNSPMETPAVNIDDILDFSAAISGSQTDETPLDNFVSLHQTVVGSIDPNDKIVAEGTSINTLDLDKYLHYTIRFQNSGTSEATNVVATDILQEHLDVNTLQILSASHPFTSKLTFERKLEFVFENINLPTAIVDEPGSHGYISFKIKPAVSVGLGSSINNEASIYFDYNFPIVTNEVSTVVTALSTDAVQTENYAVYPNPVADFICIETRNNPIQKVIVYNFPGQVLKTFSATANTTKVQIPVSDLKTGTYLIEVSSEKEKNIQKIIKL